MNRLSLFPCFFFFFLFFWPWPMACRILVPPPGIEPRPSAVKALSPNHWTAREVPFPACETSSSLALHKCLGRWLVHSKRPVMSSAESLWSVDGASTGHPSRSHTLWSNTVLTFDVAAAHRTHSVSAVHHVHRRERWGGNMLPVVTPATPATSATPNPVPQAPRQWPALWGVSLGLAIERRQLSWGTHVPMYTSTRWATDRGADRVWERGVGALLRRMTSGHREEKAICRRGRSRRKGTARDCKGRMPQSRMFDSKVRVSGNVWKGWVSKAMIPSSTTEQCGTFSHGWTNTYKWLAFYLINNISVSNINTDF